MTSLPSLPPQSSRHEVRALVVLAAPILASQLAQQALSFTDMVMAGRVSAADLAGVAVGGSLWVPLYLFIYGVILAMTPMVAQLHGAGRTGEAGPLVRRGALIALALALPAALLLHQAGLVFRWMQVDPAIAPIAAGYLRAISWGVPAAALFFLLRNLSEGLGLTRPSMLIGLASLPVNIGANYVFIYGKLGLSALGGVGCGWASALTLWFMCGCMLLILRRGEAYRATRLFDRTAPRGSEGANQMLALGLPIGASLLVESSIFALIALFLAPLGALTVAAHQITLNYSAIVFMLPLSLASAMSIRVGHAAGSGRPDLAQLASRTGIRLSGALAVLSAGFTLLFARAIAGIYTTDPQLISLAVGLLWLNALYQVSDAIQVGAAAALRGYKDTRVPLLRMLFSYWVVALPLGYSLALTRLWGEPQGARGFWLSLIVGLTLAAVLLTERLRRIEGRR